MTRQAGEHEEQGFLLDADGRLIVVPVGTGGTGGGPVDTELPAAAAMADGAANPTAPPVDARISSYTHNTPGWTRIRNAFQGDADDGHFELAVALWAWAGASYDRIRVATTFKSFASTAITAGTGATVWTPTAGKKFRLMGWSISSSAAGVLIFGDNAVGTVIARAPAVAAAGISTLGAGDLGNGILSGAADRVLKLDGPTGNVAGMVWGVEE